MAKDWRNRIIGHGEEAPDQLLANPRNWRIHPQSQQTALASVLDEVGFVDTVLVNQRTGFVLDGHLRVAMAISKGQRAIPVTYVDLSEAEEALVLATFDPLAAMAVADKDALAALLERVKGDNEALAGLVEQIARSNKIILAPQEGLTDPDDVPDVPEESYVKRGDIWLLGGHHVMCGDSTKAEDVKRLMGSQKAVLMATDPPYGDSWVQKAKDMHAHGYGHSRAVLHGSIESDDKNEVDLAIFLAAFLEAAKGAGNPPFPIYVWHRAKRILFEQALVKAGYLVHQPIVWVKPSFVIGRLHYHPRCEWALHGWLLGGGECPFYGERNQSDVWELGRENDGLHPTQKPVELFAIPIRNHTKIGEGVFDPFLGSGTTIIAAERLGRICYGMEIEPRYVQVSIERWQNFTGKKAVLLEKG